MYALRRRSTSTRSAKIRGRHAGHRRRRGLGAAIDYLFKLGIPAIAAYEHALLEYATQALATVPGLRPIGTAANKASVLAFVIHGVPNEQVGGIWTSMASPCAPAIIALSRRWPFRTREHRPSFAGVLQHPRRN